MAGMRILLANIWLKGRSGTEVVTMEMASGLVRRGHDVVVFSPDPGPSADALRQSGIRVADRLDELNFNPDVVHGNHSIDLAHGLLRFGSARGVFVCHNSDHWICSPPDLAQVRAYVAVDRLCRDRIARDLPRVRDDIRIIHNAVDLERYRPRGPLPAKPLRALALTKFSAHLPMLQEACERCGLQLDSAGPGAGVIVDDLPERLKRYDLVFATARMAIEAMAVGCAAVVVDARGLAGLVTMQTVAAWREDNYGRAILTRPVSAQAIMEEISRYDASDAACVAEDVREHHALARALPAYEAIYQEATQADIATGEDISGRELSRLLRAWLPLMDGISPVSSAEVGGRIAWLENELAARERDVAWRDRELAARAHDIAGRDRELAARERDIAWRDRELAARDRDIAWRDAKLTECGQEIARRDEVIAARDSVLDSRRALARRLLANMIRRF